MNELTTSVRFQRWLRRIQTVFLGLFLAFVRTGLVAAATDPSARPNVLFVCVDDLKPILGCYGDRRIKSPNIDRLAGRGVWFERAYCNQAVCAPSRNSLLTGVRPTRLGIYDLGTNFRQAAPDAVTLSQYFMRHGYRAEAIGKIFHTGHGNTNDEASWSVPHFGEKSIAYVKAESRAKEGLTREEALFENIKTNISRLPRGAAMEAAEVSDNAYPDGRIADEAIGRLRAAGTRRAQPFFLAIGFLKPHLPFCAPKKYWDLYEPLAFSLPTQKTPPTNAPSYAPGSWGELRQYRDMPTGGPVTDEQARALIHGYHAAVSFMDAQFGRVLDELDGSGLATNTIIMLWGDHGWHLGDHGLWCKHTNYEEANRIPLIVVAPGVTPRGRRATHTLVETVDLFPTLCALAGLPEPKVPQGLDGKSIVAALRDPESDPRQQNHAFHVFPRGERLGRAVRTARHRLIEWKVPGAPPGSAQDELYDYELDPMETRNLAEEQPETVAKLRALLKQLPEARPQIRGLPR
jgi:iduronate 2-sulfatase